MKNLFILILTALIINGCSSAPALAPPLGMPTIPSNVTDSVKSEIQLSNTYDISDNIVQSAVHTILPSSKVVINVPATIFEKESELGTGEFRTKEFFNYAEQEIERELIRHGFIVLSRSKFEAKLRNLRDENKCTERWWRCPSSRIDPEVTTILDQLEKNFNDGKITASDFADQTKEFKSKMQQSSAGRSRKEGEIELTDISEVIRAAQDGDIRSDYILQINNFDTNKISQSEVNLMQNKDIRNFLTVHPELKRQFTKKQYLRCKTTGAELNAKLIHVKTGAIVWIGKHDVNELNSDVTNLSVEFVENTYVNNKNTMMRFINEQNTYSGRVNRYGKQVNYPQWTYSKELIGPRVIEGRCRDSNSNYRMDKTTRSKLARAVAKELIKTIKVEY